jgi:hypothetical protein
LNCRLQFDEIFITEQAAYRQNPPSFRQWTSMAALATGGSEAKRALGAMMDMKKFEVAAIGAARRGD